MKNYKSLWRINTEIPISHNLDLVISYFYGFYFFNPNSWDWKDFSLNSVKLFKVL